MHLAIAVGHGSAGVTLDLPFYRLHDKLLHRSSARGRQSFAPLVEGVGENHCGLQKTSAVFILPCHQGPRRANGLEWVGGSAAFIDGYT
jgi:hypothetical protein